MFTSLVDGAKFENLLKFSSVGNFIKEDGVSSELADSCNREFCTCDTQEFPEGETFETELARK